ncbi:MAG: hypothetical protein FWE23_10280 [Chitinivibrionia bacterium]|nr:hypothetical protein [Chitinivibrionia bacterium]
MTRYYIILLCFMAINSAVFAFVENETAPQRPHNFRRERGRADTQSPFTIGIQSDLLTKRQQLILGIVVLNQRFHTFREEGYAHLLRELLRITEFSSEEAIQIINQYMNNPEKWQADLSEIRETLLATGTNNDE